MKQLIYGILISILCASCSKKTAEQPPQPHTIKGMVSGADAFNVSLSVYKTTDSSPKTVDSKIIAKGSSYSYTTTLNQNDGVTLVVASDVSNTVTYRIYDNDKIVVQDTDREIVTHGSVTVTYDIP